MTKKLFIVVIPIWCVTLIFSGCNRGVPSDLPKTYPTSITVIQDGQGLSNATVMLHPTDGSQWYASAITDTNGVAELRTQGLYAGVVVGKYKILVSKREVNSSNVTIPDPQADPEGYSKALAKANSEMKEFDLVDPKYAKPETTPEELEIIAGTNKKNIDIGKAVKIDVK
jgi:hypothetical protein